MLGAMETVRSSQIYEKCKPKRNGKNCKGNTHLPPSIYSYKICSALLYLATQLPANHPSKGYFEEADNGDPSVCCLTELHSTYCKIDSKVFGLNNNKAVIISN